MAFINNTQSEHKGGFLHLAMTWGVSIKAVQIFMQAQTGCLAIAPFVDGQIDLTYSLSICAKH
jgi:hypothetical protein